MTDSTCNNIFADVFTKYLSVRTGFSDYESMHTTKQCVGQVCSL